MVPNGGATIDRVAATLRTAFQDAEVETTGTSRVHRDGKEVDVFRFRVVSDRFRRLPNSERGALIYHALRHSTNHGPLFGAQVSAEREAEGEFNLFGPSGHEVIVVRAETFSEADVVRLPSLRTKEVDTPRTIVKGAKTTPPVTTHRFPSRREGSYWFSLTRSWPRTFRHHPLLWLGPALLLMVALAPLAYAYYIFLRFCICGASAFLAYQEWVHEDAVSKWLLAFCALAVLYNPIVPIYLSREIWSVLNIVSAIIFLGHLASVKQR